MSIQVLNAGGRRNARHVQQSAVVSVERFVGVGPLVVDDACNLYSLGREDIERLLKVVDVFPVQKTTL